ncbi:MAG: transporter substrate-binding domain-containing protein [Candidatus Sulfobium sp.]|jgi:polar amino acid transport system substrate-binding protein
MRRIIAAGMLVLFVIAGAAMRVAGADDKVVVVVDQNYPPYMYGTAQPKGLYTELIEAVFTRMGTEVEIKALPWEEALKEGEKGKAAVGGIYKNSARLKVYDYSAPLFDGRLAVYVKKGRAFPFIRLSDLQGKVIGLNRGWSYGDAFDAARKKYHFKVEEAESNVQNFRQLVAGKIDCLVADEVAASQIMHKYNLRGQVVRLDKPAAVNEAYLAFAKRLKKKDLLERFNKVLTKMKQDGSYRKLVRDFIAGGPE